MAVQQKTLSNRTVAALKVARDTVFWDRDLTGFGVRVYPTGGKVYIAQARGPDGPKRVTVGRHDVLHADQARQRAALIIARIKAGEEPMPLPLAARANGGPTVADLAARYLEEHVEVKLKPNTQRQVRGVLRRHILPALGVVSHIIRRRIFQIISGGRCADFPHYFGFTGSRHGLRRRISRPPDEGAGGSFRQARWDVALRSAGTGTGSGYAVVGARSARVRRRIRAGYPTPGRAAAVPRRRGVAGSRAGNSA